MPLQGTGMTKKHGDELGDTFLATIENSQLTEALIEAGDMSLADLIGVLNDIPVLKWITAGGKAVSSLRDYFFIKRMAAFLADFSSLSPDKRADVIRKLDTEPVYAKRAAEAVMTVLERVDSPTKAVWVSRALRAYATGEITANELMRLNAAIERILVCDVDGIVFYFENDDAPIQNEDLIGQAAVNAGLGFVASGYGAGGIHSNEMYPLFKKHVLGRQ